MTRQRIGEHAAAGPRRLIGIAIYLSDPQMALLWCRSLAHRVGRISPLSVENGETGEDGGPPTPKRSHLQRFREWRFKPMGLEPSPELVAVAVGESLSQGSHHNRAVQEYAR